MENTNSKDFQKQKTVHYGKYQLIKFMQCTEIEIELENDEIMDSTKLLEIMYNNIFQNGVCLRIE